MSTLADMTERVYEVNKANGWFDDERTFEDDIALLHSEVSEMFEAYRDWGFEDTTAQGCPSQDFPGHVCKPQGFGSEAADVLVRILDTSHRRHIAPGWGTLEEVPIHGYFDAERTVGGHISELHGLITLVWQTPISLGAPLSYLVSWCRALDLDLEAEFERKLAYNATRGHKHGGKLL